MPSVWDEMKKDGPEFLKEFGRPVIFRGKEIRAIIGRAPEMQDLTTGGFVYASSFSVRVFAPEDGELGMDKPKHGERMTVWGREYTITGVTPRPPDPWIDLFVSPSATV